MSFFVPLAVGVGALLVMVFGTRRSVETHFVDADERPGYLGGKGANTGVDYEEEYRRYHSEPDPIPSIAREIVREAETAPVGEDADLPISATDAPVVALADAGNVDNSVFDPDDRLWESMVNIDP